MKGWGAEIVATVVTVGFIAVLTLLILRPINLSDNLFQLLVTMVGFLGAAFGTVVNYYLGSSAGSANKDRLLMRGLDPATPDPAAKPANG